MSLARGLVIGLVGTAALTAFEPLERRWLGHEPPYSLPALAAHRRGIPIAIAKPAMLLLRWTYGPTWGVLYTAATRGLAPRHPMREAIALATAIASFELVVMPGVGLVRPLRTWSRRELAALAAHTLAFGLAAALTRRAL
ncbi:hypothetical protein [Sandaracinus amylolyticus]|uniref:hypothetical protein n=1 Tax=Sandaracinus amylolyticus TaxID=927083 RepID=UPI001F3DDFD9|nr:hypothetical protein [Sandaracinus amylolyticus]UJR84214.1 Hypothetical protein I5071_62860 [Sandaracinus amylolyticus]